MRPIIFTFSLLTAGVICFAQQNMAKGPALLANVGSPSTGIRPAAKQINPIFKTSIHQMQGPALDADKTQVRSLPAAETPLAEIKAFPNPFTTQIDIIITDGNMSRSVYKASLFDLNGKNVRSEILSANQSSLELSQLSTGVYFLQIEKNGALVKPEKFIKE